jgi:ElaB/YqjD/DUF883 family membrane-anchored ribosome-binding protein
MQSTNNQNQIPQSFVPQNERGDISSTPGVSHQHTIKPSQIPDGSDLSDLHLKTAPVLNSNQCPSSSHTFENAGAAAGAKVDTAVGVVNEKVEVAKEVAVEKSGEATAKLSEAFDVAGQKVEETKEFTAEKVEQTKGMAANALENAKEFTAEKVEQTREMAAHALSNTKEYLVETKDYVKEVVTDTALAAKEYVEEKLVEAADLIAGTAESFKGRVESTHIPPKAEYFHEDRSKFIIADNSGVPHGGAHGEVDYSSQLNKFKTPEDQNAPALTPTSQVE